MESTTNDSKTVDPVTEVKAMSAVVEAFKDLDAPAIGRVLDWASKRYDARIVVDRARRPALRDVSAGNGDAAADPEYADLAELYNAANPTTDADKILVAAYWHQVYESKENFDSQTLNRDLKNLGHRVGNVTRACLVLIREKPALMVQIKKSGSTKQARKLLRLTAVGLDRVRKMLAGQMADAHSEA
jgi:hypothetical protein